MFMTAQELKPSVFGTNVLGIYSGILNFTKKKVRLWATPSHAYVKGSIDTRGTGGRGTGVGTPVGARFQREGGGLSG